jgi:hypothetical protein
MKKMKQEILLSRRILRKFILEVKKIWWAQDSMIQPRELDKLIKDLCGIRKITAERVFQENKKLFLLDQVNTMRTKWISFQFISTNLVAYLFQR